MKRQLLVLCLVSVGCNLSALSLESEKYLSSIRKKEPVALSKEKPSLLAGQEVATLRDHVKPQVGYLPASEKSTMLNPEPSPVFIGKPISESKSVKVPVMGTSPDWKVFLEDEINFLSKKFNSGEFLLARRALRRKNFQQAQSELRKAKQMIKSGAILLDPAKGVWSAADDLEVGVFW